MLPILTSCLVAALAPEWEGEPPEGFKTCPASGCAASRCRTTRSGWDTVNAQIAHIMAEALPEPARMAQGKSPE